MRHALRLAASAGLLAAAAFSMRLSGAPLAAVAAAGFAIHLARHRRLRPALASMIPIAMFAAVLPVLGWLSGAADPALAVRSVAVFLLSTAAFHIAPWKWAASKLSLRSPFYMLGLFLLFVRHFTEILVGESRRTLQARGLCVRGTFGRGGFSSLGWAMVSIFRRSLARAERFHAAQSLSGIVP
jgi:hypothetical protein